MGVVLETVLRPLLEEVFQVALVVDFERRPFDGSSGRCPVGLRRAR
jgi:hypothetical protein